MSQSKVILFALTSAFLFASVDALQAEDKPKPASTEKTKEAKTEKKKKFNLGQKKYIKRQMSYFDRGSVKRFEKKCGKKLDAKIDWASFLPVMDDLMSRKINKSPYAFCELPIGNMAGECQGDEDTKATINEGVKKFVCHYGGNDGKGMKLQIKDGVLHFYVDFKSSNQDKYVTKALGEQL